MHILIVLTSHDVMGDTGEKTGFWLEELASPYYVFKDARAHITLASPRGGRPPVDPNSEKADAQTEATKRFTADSEAMAALEQTIPLADIPLPLAFDGVFYPGGHGPVWDLSGDRHSIAILEDAAKRDVPIGTVCHGPAALRQVRGPDGRPLVRGKAVTGFSNREEEVMGTSEVVPFLIEDMLAELGGNYTSAPDWQPHIEHEGTLITGQNPASSEAAAKQLLALIDVKKVLTPIG